MHEQPEKIARRLTEGFEERMPHCARPPAVCVGEQHVKRDRHESAYRAQQPDKEWRQRGHSEHRDPLRQSFGALSNRLEPLDRLQEPAGKVRRPLIGEQRAPKRGLPRLVRVGREWVAPFLPPDEHLGTIETVLVEARGNLPRQPVALGIGAPLQERTQRLANVLCEQRVVVQQRKEPPDERLLLEARIDGDAVAGGEVRIALQSRRQSPAERGRKRERQRGRAPMPECQLLTDPPLHAERLHDDALVEQRR